MSAHASSQRARQPVAPRDVEAVRGNDTTPLHDVIVLGGGPAGAAAAIEACRHGLAVALVDEAASAGGQVYRTAPGIERREPDRDPERRDGDALRRALAAAPVDVRFGQRVWQVERDGDAFHVHAVGADGPLALPARTLIVAGGAHERHVPIPGWDRPGVLGLAAATVLLKAQRMLPGRAVVVAGTGPLLLAVAAGIVKGGGRVAAIVDAQPRSAWLADWRGLASRPELLARGATWFTSLRAQRTPMFHASMLRRIDGDPGVTHVEIATRPVPGRAAAGSTVRIPCDAVCVGFGLAPATDVTRLLGALHGFDASRGGWHVVTDDTLATTVPGLFACGDTAGIEGAAAAPWSGRIAAITAAHHLRRLDDDALRRLVVPMQRERARAARFGAAMTRVADADDGVLADLPADTPVCLCERLPRRAIDAAIDAGARTLSEVKSATRCGMGPCGGRVCEDAAARLIALRTGASRAAIGQATGRPPLRPVELDRLAGEFDYDALPIAQPAPL